MFFIFNEYYFLLSAQRYDKKCTYASEAKKLYKKIMDF